MKNKSKNRTTEENLEEINLDDQKEKESDTPAKEEATLSCNEQKEEAEGNLEQLKKSLEELKTECTSYKEQFIRKHADFENYRKRMQKEKQDTVRYGNQELLLDLLDVIDNFNRAVKSAEESQDFQSFHDGIIMIEKQLSGILSGKYGLAVIESVGNSYDPSCHEAMMLEESDKFNEAVVIEDFQPGYKLYDRVLRPAKVKVGKPVEN